MKENKVRFISCIFLLFTMILSGCSLNENNSESNTEGTNYNTVLPEAIANSKYYTITVSVNPEIELYVSSDSNEVVYVNCCNDDATEMINEKNLNLNEKDYNEAVEEFVIACADSEYLNQNNNNIDIVASAAHDETVEIPTEYGEKMSSVVNDINEYVDFTVNISVPCPCCDATGKCSLCNGEKTMICDVCNGNRTWVCDECSGKSTILCTSCAGSGILEDSGVCEVCNGEATWTCQNCGGSGKAKCDICGGSGGCSVCGNSGKQICNLCNGAGCAMCGNSGLMECTICHGNSCSECGGTGEQYCGTCIGTGTCKCNSCDGTGTYNRSHECGDCAGTGERSCLPCLGTGTCKCYGCDGEGVVTCVRCNGDGLCPSCHGAGELAHTEPDDGN